MRLLVYTCVVGGYDRIFPPVVADPAVDYVAFTDEPRRCAAGWRTLPVDAPAPIDARSTNRRYKMLGHRDLPGYDASIYVDGNIRLLGPVSDLLDDFIRSGAAMGLFPHPLRSSVSEEIDACVGAGKSSDLQGLAAEFESYQCDGFDDELGLFEAGVLLKNHAHPGLDTAMTAWHESYLRWKSRDQISLPYVLWKTGIDIHRYPHSFREPNPYFGLYSHAGAKNLPPHYAYVSARAYDNRLFRALLAGWHAKWQLQRRLRRLAKGGQ